MPLFQRFGVEDQLAAMYQPIVQLKSGGYLVINPTEALVSIDINSGRSTREHNIEQTAFATNLEAANEIARQLRLRDMAGLVVIDFIDMEQNGHVRKVEKAMKEALKNDRARIQVGRISSFGLMEMSRQRLRTGVLEASTRPCPHCEGTGLMRTAASAGLSALRMIEEEAARGRGSQILLRAGREAAVYVLNKKRHEIAEVEERYGVAVEIMIDEALEGAKMSVEAHGPRPVERPRFETIVPAVEEEDLVEDQIEDEDELEAEEGGEEAPSSGEQRRDDEREAGGRRRRRRRGRRGGRNREGREEGAAVIEDNGATTDVNAAEPLEPAAEPVVAAIAAPEEPGTDEEAPRKARRRPRARKKVNGAEDAAAPAEVAAETTAEAPPEPEAELAADAAPAQESAPATEVAATEEAPAKPRRTRRKKADVAEVAPAEAAPVPQAANDEAAPEEAPAKPKRRTRAKKAAAPAGEEQSNDVASPAEPVKPVAAPEAVAPQPTAPSQATASPQADEAEDEPSTPRRGWWQRTFGA